MLRRTLCLLLMAGGLLGAAAAPIPTSLPDISPEVLIVGGGPEKNFNQAAIESNVRYVLKLFTHALSRITLFADGDPHSATVAYEDPPSTQNTEEAALAMVLTKGGHSVNPVQFRSPELPQMDGPSNKKAVDAAFDRLAHSSSGHPMILYFTGHGSQNQKRDDSGNIYLLWHDDLSVRELASRISRLPARVPIILIMAQCYAGDFARILFTGTKPGAALIPQDMVGFFGTTADRVAAGCTPDIREKDYQDFTTYFMAALSGQNRLGEPLIGADYNHDGQVGMDEAFCYALIHDLSIDVPVCTSDTFLRDRLKISEDQVFQAPLQTVRSWGTPAQQVAMDSLASELAGKSRPQGDSVPEDGNSSEPDMMALYKQYQQSASSDAEGVETATTRQYGQAARRFSRLRSKLRQRLLDSWPSLDRPGTDSYAEARKAALAALATTHSVDAAALVRDSERLEQLSAQWEQEEIAQARRLRLLRLVKTVYLTHQLLRSPAAPDAQDLQRILKGEQRPLFSAAV